MTGQIAVQASSLQHECQRNRIDKASRDDIVSKLAFLALFVHGNSLASCIARTRVVAVQVDENVREVSSPGSGRHFEQTDDDRKGDEDDQEGRWSSTPSNCI